MAPLALLYDVHGNLPALEAVLEDAGGAGAERFLLGGDYALFGAWPAETVALPARARDGRLDPRQLRARGGRGPIRRPDNPVLAGAVASLRELPARIVTELAELPEQAVHRRRPLLPRLAGLGHALVSAPASRRRGRAPGRSPRAAGGLRPHASPLRPPSPARDRAQSTQAASACPSTATRARPMRWSTTMAASSTGGSPTTTKPVLRPCASGSAIPSWTETVTRRIRTARPVA